MDKNKFEGRMVRKQKRRQRELILWLCIGIAVLTIFGLALAVIFHTPNVTNVPPFPTGEVSTSTGETSGEDVGTVVDPYERKEGFYTFLVAGMDAVSSNTDVLMLASLNTNTNEIHIVQIPRDTYIKGKTLGYGSLTRVNAIFSAEYNYQLKQGISNKTARTLAMQSLQKYLSEALCINIDEYVLINTSGFRSVIDAVGGIYYDVPCDMFYEDPEQDLYIDLKEGYQHLDGAQCEQLIRYRSGYTTGDIERVELRADFMIEVFKQVKNNISLDSMLDLIRDKELMQKVSTSMSLMDIFSYVRMVYKLDDDSVSVRKLSGEVLQNPHTGAWIYYCLNKKAALADINECLNVYKSDIDIAIFDKKGLFSGTENGNDDYIYEYYHS